MGRMRPVTTWYSTDKRWDNRPSTIVGQAPSRDNYKGPAANKVIEDIDTGGSVVCFQLISLFLVLLA